MIIIVGSYYYQSQIDYNVDTWTSSWFWNFDGVLFDIS